ncbi:MAG: CotH kinase family protein [Clostridia bacterium]|nr:CotH kinase family protein [Clostridia bacterium]
MLKMPRLALCLMILALAACLALSFALSDGPAWQGAVLAAPVKQALPQAVDELAAITHLPILYITTQSGALPTEADEAGQLMLITPGVSSHLATYSIEINLRGNTSQRFPKQSYRVKIVDTQGEKQNASLASLRSDDDWILNPMYSDTSKIREALAYELWAWMNSSGVRAASSRLAYAEVFLNGQYWGLYGVQERIDRKQVEGDKQASVLYKVIANDRPAVQELMTCTDPEYCGGFKLSYAGTYVKNPWLPAASYMALLNGEANPAQAMVSLSNAIDYGLWAMLTQAHDCHFKNQFLHAVYTGNGYTLYKIPWDVNNTFGDVWQNEAADTNHTAYSIGRLVLDGVFEVLVNTGDAQIIEAIQQRWAALRQGPLQLAALVDKAYELYTPLFDAIQRDSDRWPQGGMGNGNALNIRDLDTYFETILPRMDDYIMTLGTGENLYGEDLDR